MRAVTKTLGVGLLAAAAAVGLRCAPSRRAPRRPRPRRRGGTPGTGFAYGTDSWPVTGHRQRPVQGAGHRQQLQRLHGHGGQLGAHREAARPATSSPGRRPTPARRTRTTSSTTSASASASTGTWAAPASTRTGTAPPPRPTTGASAGALGARGDQGQVHPLPGDLGRHRAAGDRSRPGQRLEQRLHLAVQRSGQAGLRARGRRPGGVQRVRGLHHRALHVQGRRLLGPDDLASHLRHRAATPASRTPTSGPTRRRPRTCRPRRPAGACTARRRAPSSSAGRPRRASTP